MTDKMRAREEAICKAAKVKNIGEVSDGFHTFDGLYEQRMILFAALVKAYKEKAWKSYRHEDGEYCFGGGWFIVGIDTPEGSYTYHYENKYWDMFDCINLPRAKHWDGHTEADAETRLMSLNPERKDGDEMTDDTISRQAAIDALAEWQDAAITNRLNNLPSAQPVAKDINVPVKQPGWIPCSERLPKEKDAGILKKLGTEKRSEYVLATVEVKGERMTVTACTYDGKWDWNMKYAFPDYKVVAWMPMPDPWKGGGNENDRT